MTSPIPIRSAFLVAALAFCGCGDGDIRIKIDASRVSSADQLSVFYCSASGTCDLGSDAFDGTTQLSAKVQVHVPTGHTPVPLLFIYDYGEPGIQACKTANVNLAPDAVEINVAVGGDPTLDLTCPPGVCTDETTPANCSSF
jgi:hypothetical protein